MDLESNHASLLLDRQTAMRRCCRGTGQSVALSSSARSLVGQPIEVIEARLKELGLATFRLLADLPPVLLRVSTCHPSRRSNEAIRRYDRRRLNTRVGPLVLRVPQDRSGHLSTQVFEQYQRSEKALVAALAAM